MCAEHVDVHPGFQPTQPVGTSPKVSILKGSENGWYQMNLPAAANHSYIAIIVRHLLTLLVSTSTVEPVSWAVSFNQFHIHSPARRTSFARTEEWASYSATRCSKKQRCRTPFPPPDSVSSRWCSGFSRLFDPKKESPKGYTPALEK